MKMNFDIVVDGKNYKRDREGHEFSSAEPAKSVQLINCVLRRNFPDGLLKHHKGITNFKVTKCKFDNGSVPDTISTLKDLRQLSLSECGLREFPVEIIKLSALSRLIMGNSRKCQNQWKNSFSSIPQCLGQLKHLKHLDLSWCRLEKCPQVVSKLQSLESLNLHGNFYMETLAPLMLGNLTNLEHLDVNYCGLSQCPVFPTEMKKLRHVNMGLNNFRSINDSVKNLTNLQCLDISICELTEFPEAVTNIKTLVHLNLSGNVLKELSESIVKLTKLQHLDVSKCSITECPDYIGELKSLRHLDLSNNDISDLPMALASLEHLRELCIVNCNMEVLPSVCEKISANVQVDFHDTPIATNIWFVEIAFIVFVFAKGSSFDCRLVV